MFKTSRFLLGGHNRTLAVRYFTKFRKNRNPFVEIEEQIEEFIKSESTEPVDSFKSRLLASSSKETYNFDAIFLRLCVTLNAVDLGKRHFRQLTTCGSEPGLATVGKYLVLCSLDPSGCNDDDKKLVDSLYRQIVQKYDGLVDHSTCEALVLGLCAVGRWQEAQQWLDKAVDFGSPPSRRMFSSVVDAAISNGCEEDGWRIMDRMGSTGKAPLALLYERLSSPKGRLEKLLFWHQMHDIAIPLEAVEIIRDASSNDFTTTDTGVTYNGRCKSCQKTLQPLTISNHEFDRLRRAFLKPVLVGNDLFLKSRPEELKHFLSFLDIAGRVDVVLDGLNIAYSGKSSQMQNPSHCAKTLRSVTQYFLNQNRKVMIVGRKHMLKWPRQHVDFLKNNCLVFFTEDLSADDPYLLYATMTSGLGTIFVSRDQMRSHKFLLSDPDLTRIFSKWRQIHQKQLRYVNDGHVSLQSSVPYEMTVQKSKDGTWHLPITCEQIANVRPHLVPNTVRWLCMEPEKFTND